MANIKNMMAAVEDWDWNSPKSTIEQDWNQPKAQIIYLNDCEVEFSEQHCETRGKWLHHRVKLKHIWVKNHEEKLKVKV